MTKQQQDLSTQIRNAESQVSQLRNKLDSETALHKKDLMQLRMEHKKEKEILQKVISNKEKELRSLSHSKSQSETQLSSLQQKIEALIATIAKMEKEGSQQLTTLQGDLAAIRDPKKFELNQLSTSFDETKKQIELTTTSSNQKMSDLQNKIASLQNEFMLKDARLKELDNDRQQASPNQEKALRNME